MKRLLLLLIALLLPFSALAAVTIPSSVTEVEDEAFANTAIDALIVPASVRRVGADVLRGSGASYIYLQGASTALSNAGGAAFVFGPAASPASALDNFHDAATLVTHEGLYYTVTGTALPLCAKAPESISGSVTIPKLLEGVPVTSVNKLYLSATGVTEVRVPAYLGQVPGMKTTAYQTMFLTAPQPDATEVTPGNPVTWSTEVTGAYGKVSYEWRIEQDGTSETLITAVPTVQYAPKAAGVCNVTVTAKDALGDSAAASGGQVTVTRPKSVYRALLVGNTYVGEAAALNGPAADVSAMRTMLGSMTGTPFKINTVRNTSASGIKSAIASTFSGAQANDVSLFYFSGHGTPKGELVGTGNTFLSVYGLRSALQQVPGLKIVLLDCCYSGSSISRSTASPSSFNSAIISALSSASRSSENLADSGYVVLTACRQDQMSVSVGENNENMFGAFTYGLCYGSGYDEWKKTSLGRMPADSNGDGAITLSEAYKGIKERIAYLNTLMPIEQACQSWGDSGQVLWRK